MDVRATGIVLASRPLTETSLITHWITLETGRLSTVAKGARRPKSPFRGKLDLFYKAEISFAKKEGGDLHNLKEVVLKETFPRLRENYSLLKQASYVSRLVEKHTEREAEIPSIYYLVENFLTSISMHPASRRYVLTFELKFLDELGLRPDFKNLSPANRSVAQALLHSDWKELPSLKITTGEGKALMQFLHGFLIYHLGGVERSRAEIMGTS